MSSQDHGIHSFKECVPEGSDCFQQILGRAHRRRSSTHNKRKEDGRNWRSIFHDSKKIPQEMRNMKKSILQQTIIHPKHLDKKWCCYEWRRWWSWRPNKESTHETNKDKYQIIISLYYLVLHLFIFSWCVMHDRMFALMIVYY